MNEPVVPIRITPRWFQAPPRGVLASSQSVWAGPPSTAILLSLVVVKKPRARLSGDQNGKAAPSVPATGRALKVSIGRIHSKVLPLASPATKAIMVPSGEIVPPFDPSGAPSGDAQVVCSGAVT